MEHQATFSKFKEDFYSRFDDISIFDCGDFNILKIVLDGLKVNYYQRSKNKNSVVFTFQLSVIFLYVLQFYYRLKLFIKGISYSQSVSFKNKEYLLIDIGGVTWKNGEVALTFYDKIISAIGKEKCFIFFNSSQDSVFYQDIKTNHLEHLYDLTKEEHIVNAYGFVPQDIALKRNLIKTYNKLKESELFSKTELFNIAYAIELFYRNFNYCSTVFRGSKFKKAFIICHYHKEYIIYYLKKRKVPIIELQHGIIAQSDIFYVFPKVVATGRDKCLFPDYICVFGEFWKKVLLSGYEYLPNNIYVIGDYMAGNINFFINNNDTEIINSHFTKKIILVATQTYLEKHYISYVKFLSEQIKDNDEWIIVVKIHPAESLEKYADIRNLKNVILTKNMDLSTLLSKSNIVISIYSSVLFDSLKYSLFRFTLLVDELSDYVKEIINNGIAFPLKNTENPLDIIQNSDVLKSESIHPDYFYKPYTNDAFFASTLWL